MTMLPSTGFSSTTLARPQGDAKMPPPVWGMDPNQQLEQLSRAYVRAVAAVAGLAVYEPEVDHDSIDLGLAARGGPGTIRSPRLEIQLKATRQDLLRDDGIHYPLKLKNYEDLRGSDLLVPRILVLVLVPPEPGDWLSQSEDELVLRRCGYWLSLHEQPPTASTSSVVVVLPSVNLFTVEAVHGIMERISRQEPP
jgi:hypothetical protein